MLKTLEKYILKEFIAVFLTSLFIFSTLFVVFEFFDRIDNFIKEKATLLQIISYIIYKIPLVIQLMTPIAVLVATLVSVGKLSQNSEITAMRACGVSVFNLIKPLLLAGGVISGVVLLSGETLVPWSTDRLQTLYHLDIKKKAQTGAYNRSDFWFRNNNKFYNVGLYDSRFSVLKDISIFEVDSSFNLEKITEAVQANWGRPEIGWIMEGIVESYVDPNSKLNQTMLRKASLPIKEAPEDFYNFKRKPEAMTYKELKSYASKLQSEGISITNYKVDLARKISFPLVNFIIVLTAFPFALGRARSGTATKSFIAAITIGFGYHFLHALSCSLGSAGLLPVTLSAWVGNILFALLGLYLILGKEYD